MAGEIKETFDSLLQYLAILNDFFDYQYNILSINCEEYRKFLQFVSKPKPTKNSEERIQLPPSNITSGDANTTESISVLNFNDYLEIENLLQKSKLIRHDQFRKPIDVKRAISPKNLPLIKPLATKEKLESVSKNRSKVEPKITRRQSTSCIKSCLQETTPVTSRTGTIPKEKMNLQFRNDSNEPKSFDFKPNEVLKDCNGDLKFPFEVQKAMRLNKHAVVSSKKCLFSDCPARNDFLDEIRSSKTEVQNPKFNLIKQFADLRTKTDSILSKPDSTPDELKREIEHAHEKFQKLDVIYKKLANTSKTTEKQKFVKKFEPKINLVQDFFESQNTNGVSLNDDIEQILKHNEIVHDIQQLQLQLHIHETLQKSVVPLLQKMSPDDKYFIPLLRCVYGILCSEGDSFPIFIKDTAT